MFSSSVNLYREDGSECVTEDAEKHLGGINAAPTGPTTSTNLAKDDWVAKKVRNTAKDGLKTRFIAKTEQVVVKS